MARGTVRWFNDKKGYGFIQAETGQDVFVHHKEIRSSGYRTLKEGQNVEFDVEQGEKGPKAVRVVPAEAAATEQPAQP